MSYAAKSQTAGGPQGPLKSGQYSNGFQFSQGGFSAIREEIIDKNGALFKLGTHTPAYQLKQETYVPRSEAIELIKQIEQEAKNRIDQYKEFTIQLKNKYDLFEKESHAYYYDIIDQLKAKINTHVTQKKDLLAKLSMEKQDYEKCIQELNGKILGGHMQLELFAEQNERQLKQISSKQDVIYDLESKLDALTKEHQMLLNKEPEKVYVEVDKLIYVDKPDDNTVDYAEFEQLIKWRADNKEMIKYWYQQFLRDHGKPPELEDFKMCQGLVNHYMELNHRYTELKLRLLRTENYKPRVEKFQPPEVIKEVVVEKQIEYVKVEVEVPVYIQAPAEAKDDKPSAPKMGNFFSEAPQQQQPNNDAELSKLTQEKQSLESEIEAFKKDLQMKELRNNELQEQIQRLEAMLQQNVSENALLDGFRREIATQKALVSDRDAKIDKLIQSEKELSDKKNEIVMDLQKLTKANKKLRARNEELAKELEEAMARPTGEAKIDPMAGLTQQDFGKHLRMSDNPFLPNETARSSIAMEHQKAQHDAQVSQLENAHKMLNFELDRLRRENEDLNNQIEILKKVTPGEIKVIEKRIEVPIEIEKIVEKIVHVPVEVRVELPVPMPQSAAQSVGAQSVQAVSQPQQNLNQSVVTEKLVVQDMFSDRTNQQNQSLVQQQPAYPQQQQPLIIQSSQRSEINPMDTSFVKNLQNDALQKDAHIATLTQQVSDLQSQLKQEPRVEIKTDREAAQKVLDLEAQAALFRQKLDKKKQKIALYKQQKAQLENDLEQLRQASSNQHGQVVAEYQAQIRQHETEIQTLKQERDKLISGGQESVAAMNKAHEDQVNQLIAKNKGDINQREELIGNLRVQIEQVTGQNKQMQNRIAQLEAAIAEKDKSEAKMVEKIGQLSQMAGEAANLKQEVEGLTSELNALKKDHTVLEEKFKEEQKKRKQLHNELEDSKGQIRLYCRVRPLTKSELEREESKHMAIKIQDEMSLHITNRNGQLKTFNFDSVFGPTSTQVQVFDESKRLVQSAIDGFNVCIFAYGQTGSGKTFTIQGNAANPGLTPRTIQELFDLTAQMNIYNIQLRCYMVELYKEDLRDLLLPKNAVKKALEIKESSTGQVVINNVTEVELHSAEDANRIFNYGLEHRMTRQTKMNEASSRSHLIFSLVIEAFNKQTRVRTVGKLSFVDLAGSESQKKTGTDKEGAEEAKAINKSLSALGNVIEALSKGSSHVPYRDHTLTKVMKDSLGGTAKTLMFVNVSPSVYNQQESINSMDYATRVKKIKNQVKLNVESKETSGLKKMVQGLEFALDQYKQLLLKSNMASELEALQKQLLNVLPQEQLDSGPSTNTVPNEENKEEEEY